MKKIATKLILSLILACSFTMAPIVNAAERHEETRATSIPMVTDVQQISPNQLKVTYDQPVDRMKGVEPRNYWIQSMTEEMPTGIATLGKNDKVNASNSLTASRAAIQAIDNTNQSFVISFTQNITRGKAYKMIICYVTKPGAPPYSGDNGSKNFIGR